MERKSVTIKNKLGMHARPAALLVQKANEFKSNIKIEREDHVVDCKSIMGIMMLALEKGAALDVVAEGIDEKEAVKTITELIDSKFGEE